MADEEYEEELHNPGIRSFAGVLSMLSERGELISKWNGLPAPAGGGKIYFSEDYRVTPDRGDADPVRELLEEERAHNALLEEAYAEHCQEAEEEAGPDGAWFGMHATGLRRYVFDIGPERLLLLSGALLVFAGTSQCQGLLVRVEVASDFTNEVTRVETEEPASEKPITVCRVHPMPSSHVGRLFAVSLLPHFYSETRKFEPALLRVELYGTLYRLPDEMRSPIERGAFLFDESSKTDYTRVVDLSA